MASDNQVFFDKKILNLRSIAKKALPLEQDEVQTW